MPYLCPACKSPLKEIGKVTYNPKAYAGKDKWIVFECENCKHKEMIPR
jgi:RNase P subunit RPR2